MRDTSKEIGDRVADRYPVPPAALTAQALVDQMVKLCHVVFVIIGGRFDGNSIVRSLCGFPLS
jgi:hypothetical protein